MGVIIREQRKKRGLTQQDLAVAAGVSVQAVSKWEIGQSLPDVTLLPDIADGLGLPLAALFGREETREEAGAVEARFPDDGRLRVAQFLGNRLLTSDLQTEDTPPIPLAIEEALKRGLTEDQLGRLALNVEIRGSANIEGDIQGDAQAGARVVCMGNIGGDAQANGGIECHGDIGGDASAGGSLSCGGGIGGDASAGGSLTCGGDIQGDVSAKGGLNSKSMSIT
ncbi:MAG: helix-turn-helix transcriptional regulator [Clostridia bacterium]|nr:helix-turn-helix transcriptional regulator [Clostridia bacterium]